MRIKSLRWLLILRDLKSNLLNLVEMGLDIRAHLVAIENSETEVDKLRR